MNQKANQRKWRPIKNEALKSIASKLRNLSLDVSKFFEDTTPVIGLPGGLSREEGIRRLDREQNRLIRELVGEDENRLFERIDEEYIDAMEEALKDGYFGLFSLYQKDLNYLELKYGDYLGPQKRLILIKLQKELDGLMFTFKLKKDFGEDKTQFKNMLVYHSKKILEIIIKTGYLSD